MIGRFDIFRRIQQLDPQADCQQIVLLVGTYENPWLIRKSLEFALFRSYGVPQISSVLDQTVSFAIMVNADMTTPPCSWQRSWRTVLTVREAAKPSR